MLLFLPASFLCRSRFRLALLVAHFSPPLPVPIPTLPFLPIHLVCSFRRIFALKSPHCASYSIAFSRQTSGQRHNRQTAWRPSRAAIRKHIFIAPRPYTATPLAAALLLLFLLYLLLLLLQLPPAVPRLNCLFIFSVPFSLLLYRFGASGLLSRSCSLLLSLLLSLSFFLSSSLLLLFSIPFHDNGIHYPPTFGNRQMGMTLSRTDNNACSIHPSPQPGLWQPWQASRVSAGDIDTGLTSGNRGSG